MHAFLLVGHVTSGSYRPVCWAVGCWVLLVPAGQFQAPSFLYILPLLWICTMISCMTYWCIFIGALIVGKFLVCLKILRPLIERRHVKEGVLSYICEQRILQMSLRYSAASSGSPITTYSSTWVRIKVWIVWALSPVCALTNQCWREPTFAWPDP